MESKDISNSIFSVSNQRRVLKSLTKFKDHAYEHPLFIGCDSMYAHNEMDGRIKVFSFEDLVASSVDVSEVALSGNTRHSTLKERHHVATQYGTTESAYFNFNGLEYIVAGQEDGTVQIYDYGKNKDKVHKERNIFTVTNEANNQTLTHPDETFAESLYEHIESVSAIEKNFKDPLSFASAGKDSSVCFWKFSESDEPVKFQKAIEKEQFG